MIRRESRVNTIALCEYTASPDSSSRTSLPFSLLSRMKHQNCEEQTPCLNAFSTCFVTFLDYIITALYPLNSPVHVLYRIFQQPTSRLIHVIKDVNFCHRCWVQG